MALELRQQLKLAQQLVMTPQLQQAIKLLQLSRLELTETVQQEIEQNPVLEETGPSQDTPEQQSPGMEQEQAVPEKTTEVSMESDSSLKEINWEDYANEYESSSSFRPQDNSDLPSRFDILTKKPNLADHLQWQLTLSQITSQEAVICEFIIGNLNRDGFLEISFENIVEEAGGDPELAEKMLELIQSFDPPGIGARDVKESLILQLDRFELSDTLASTIVTDYLHLLENKNYALIAKKTRHSMDDVLVAVKIIMDLDPHPGRVFSDEEPHYIIPDVHVYKMDGEYVIVLNDEGLPRLKISPYYRNILKNEVKAPDNTKNYIQEKLKSAVWLIKSIQQRQRTIFRVVESLVKFQKEFFDNGIAHLKPLVLKDVAEDLEMHESTISRVTTNKYVHTPQGTFELKYFFNNAISQIGGDALASESVKDRIRNMIKEENPDKPYSDKAIADLFADDGIKLARRTVAKYREQMAILPSRLRKRPKL
jgi:RNA polymerase sigma-54 factor